MLDTEYIRSLNANYERLLLEQKPEEKRYQYCMISRGGIKGLLSCSLRYIDGDAYLYYDITSKQNIAQLFEKRPITRQWMLDFLWSIRRVRGNVTVSSGRKKSDLVSATRLSGSGKERFLLYLFTIL